MSYLGLQESGLPALVFDVLETWAGDWFSIERLGAFVEEHRPGRYPPATLERTVGRLAKAGTVEQRSLTRPAAAPIVEIRRTGREYLLQIA